MVKQQIKLIFKNKAPFRSCISKINNTFTKNAEDLDIVMPRYNLLEYSKTCSMISGNFWNYYRHEINPDAKKMMLPKNNSIHNNKIITSKSFECKTKIIGRTPPDNNSLDTEVVVPLKYLINFWIFPDLPVIDCETELDLS